MKDLANFKEKYTWNMIEREKILSYYNKAFIADIHDTSMHECQHALERLFSPFPFSVFSPMEFELFIRSSSNFKLTFYLEY